MKDPIIEEIHEIRKKITEKNKFNLAKIIEQAKLNEKLQSQKGRKIVAFMPKKIHAE